MTVYFERQTRLFNDGTEGAGEVVGEGGEVEGLIKCRGAVGFEAGEIEKSVDEP